MTMVYVLGGEFQTGGDDGEVDAVPERRQAYYVNPCQRAWFEVEQPVRPVVLHDTLRHLACRATDDHLTKCLP